MVWYFEVLKHYYRIFETASAMRTSCFALKLMVKASDRTPSGRSCLYEFSLVVEQEPATTDAPSLQHHSTTLGNVQPKATMSAVFALCAEERIADAE
jgi:hypothetical protein